MSGREETRLQASNNETHPRELEADLMGPKSACLLQLPHLCHRAPNGTLRKLTQ